MKKRKPSGFSTILALVVAVPILWAATSSTVQAAPASTSAHRHIDPALLAEGRIAFLKAVLQIKDEQRAPWDRLASVIRTHAGQREALRPQTPDAGQTMSAAAKLEKRAHRISLRAKGMEDFAAAFKSLYEVFSPEQKATADALLGRWGHWGQFGHLR
jgi:LTXXQ motif family protein